MKHILISLLFLNFWGYSFATSITFSEKVVSEYTYTITVNGNIIELSYVRVCEDKNEKEKESTSIIKCDPTIGEENVLAELKARIYWELACEAFFEMAENEGQYNHELYLSGKEMLKKCLSCLSEVQNICPGSFKKANEFYIDLVNAEGFGAETVWEEIETLGFAMGEYPLELCHIYDY